mgnify:FL=1
MSRSRTLALVGAAALLLVSAAPALAQDDASGDSAMDMEGLAVDVGGVEYAFTRLPTSVPAGTTLTFTNEGVEIHEMIVNRLADGVTESFDELLALTASGVDLEAEGYIDTDFGNPMLLAMPDQTAEGSITLEQEGRYAVLCFIPTGMEPAALEEFGVDITTLGPDTDLSTLSPEAQAYIEEVSANPPHMAQGMIQEFVVTAEGTEVGPLPAEVADEMAEAEEEVAEAREEIEEEKEEAKEQATD